MLVKINYMNLYFYILPLDFTNSTPIVSSCSPLHVPNIAPHEVYNSHRAGSSTQLHSCPKPHNYAMKKF